MNYKNYNLDEREEGLILEQIKYLHGKFVSIQQHFVGLISVSLAVYAIIIYYAIGSAEQEIFLFLPFLFSLSIYNILKYTIKVLGLDAYIRQLEKLINVTHQKSLFLWQNYLVYANGYSSFGAFSQLPCFLAMGIFLVTVSTMLHHQQRTHLTLFFCCNCSEPPMQRQCLSCHLMLP